MSEARILAASLAVGVTLGVVLGLVLQFPPVLVMITAILSLSVYVALTVATR